MAKNLRINILQYIKANGGEYETVDLAPMLLKTLAQIKRSNIKAVLKDLHNEGYIVGHWKGLSFLNNVDGTMKKDDEINATATITQKGISLLVDNKLKVRQTLLATITIISLIFSVAISIYSVVLKSEIKKLESDIDHLESRVSDIETNPVILNTE
ncbi:MAG TPA: hypothetical protein VK183_12935 [Flavobacterium sp.]|nr:hypothetical protein [Flavobacterium sp.]